MAVEAVLGGELAWVADPDPGAAAILAHRFPAVKNLGDIRTADWAAVEPVDLLAFGFPCQTVSAAGRRKGISDERWLFDDICAAIGRMGSRPRLLVLENVPGLLSANGGDAMARVVQGLAALGYEFTYRLVRASDAGAPHRRERWFCLAWLAADARGDEPGGDEAVPGDDQGDAWLRPWPGDRGAASDADSTAGGQHEPGCGPGPVQGAAVAERAAEQPGRLHSGSRGAVTVATEDPDSAASDQRREPAPGQAEGGGPRADARRSGGAPAADTGSAGLGEHPGEPPAEEAGPYAGDEPAGDRGPWPVPGGRPAPDWGPYEPAIRRWEHVTGREAPRPTEPGRTGDRLSPRFVEFLMGLPEGWVTDVPGLSRNAQLKALGNGCVPQQVALALRLLLDRAGFCDGERAA